MCLQYAELHSDKIMYYCYKPTHVWTMSMYIYIDIYFYQLLYTGRLLLTIGQRLTYSNRYSNMLAEIHL